MLDFLQTIGAFVLTLGLLITVHEWGHYQVAKSLGVKILRFSVGFGKPLWSRKVGADQTEFVIAALPLGGYVKMLDEQEADVSPDEAHRAFNRQSLAVRSAVVMAGPLLNFIFAAMIYTLIYLIGVQGVKPLVGEVDPAGLAAQAGFKSGQEIMAVNGRNTPHWEAVMQSMLSGVMRGDGLTYLMRNGNGNDFTLTMPQHGLVLDDFAERRIFDKLGFERYQPPIPPVVSHVSPDSAAQRGGLQVGDELLSANGKSINDWIKWTQLVYASPEKNISVRVKRGNELLTLTLTPDNKEGHGYLGVGAKSLPWPKEYIQTERYALWEALLQSIIKTWDISVLTLLAIGKMLTFEISFKHISGPVSIAQHAGYSFDAGMITFMKFLALVSISLGVLNLLPIPLLDGGHLLFYLLEWVKGGPVSESVQFFLLRIGLVLLLMLMSLAFFNDFNRILG